MIPTYTLTTPVQTAILRTPVSGPKPGNTLAFIRCKGQGRGYDTSFGDLFRYKIRFTTTFQIAGFTQANHEWYRANTLVSAAPFVRLLNISNDIGFVFAIDSIAADIDDRGNLAFEVQVAMQLSELGLFEREVDAVFAYEVSAYVLVYEPRVEPPPPGKFGKRLAFQALPPQFGSKRKLVFTDDPRLVRKASAEKNGEG